ncbi:hypothetical protein [Oceanicola sp. S124]|uniref:hypothetical protein n=1 Tax=Oceanicola sp. S124 TaxID=1042378 RepID=UPI000255A6A4|nr:hypothetical protein [Oceanicola sp. S124]
MMEGFQEGVEFSDGPTGMMVERIHTAAVGACVSTTRQHPVSAAVNLIKTGLCFLDTVDSEATADLVASLQDPLPEIGSEDFHRYVARQSEILKKIVSSFERQTTEGSA